MYLPLFMAYANRNFGYNSVKCESSNRNTELITKHHYTEEHREFINQYRIRENSNPPLFVKFDRFIFLKYGFEFGKRDRPIIGVKDHYNLDFSNPIIF